MNKVKPAAAFCANEYVLWHQKLQISWRIFKATVFQHQSCTHIFYRGGQTKLLPATIDWLNEKGFEVKFEKFYGKFVWTISWSNWFNYIMRGWSNLLPRILNYINVWFTYKVDLNVIFWYYKLLKRGIPFRDTSFNIL